MRNPAKQRALAFFTLVFIALWIPPQVSGTGTSLKGTVDSLGHGYQVKVSINGVNIKIITGGGHQMTRVFSSNHPMKPKVPPDKVDIFVLREGENAITVEFEKANDAQTPLEVKIEIPDRYSVPLFHLKSQKRTAGKLERKFIIEKTMPPQFKPVTVDDDTL